MAGARAPKMTKNVKRIVLPVLRLNYSLLDRIYRVHKSPVFVLGHHKTGTTAVALLLGAISGERVSMDPFNARERYPLSELFHGGLAMAPFVQSVKYHFSQGIIKEPDLTYLFDELKVLFPNAHFVFTIRDPRETIRSILDRLGIAGHREELSFDEQCYIQSLPGWRIIFDGRTLDIPSSHYIDVLSYRWKMAAEIYLKNRQSFCLIRYEDFVNNRETSIRELAACVSLPAKHDISNRLGRSYQPSGIRRGLWHEVFGESNLQRIDRICGPTARHFDYPSTCG